MSNITEKVLHDSDIETATNDFKPILRFTVVSDVHIQRYNDIRSRRMAKMFKTSYAIAQADENYKKLDGVIFAGDSADTGAGSQFMTFQSVLSANIKKGTQPMVIIAKSHDCGSYKKSTLTFFETLSGLTTDYHHVLKGFHFIGISTTRDQDTDVKYTGKQLAWLDTQLAKAAAVAPGKPIFVAHHEHVADTVYGSRESLGEGWGTPIFNEILSKYPQIIDFSGHSHYPINDPRSIWQGDFTALGTASLDYFEFTVDDVRTVHPKNNSNAAQMWLVEADANYRVRLRGYDLISDNYICEYMIEKPSDKSTFAYTPEKIAASSSAPVFAVDTAVEISQNITDKTYSVKIPAAHSTDGKIVFIYRVYVNDTAGTPAGNFWELSGYYFTPSPETVSVNIGKLKNGTYNLKIVAENAYGMQSEPITQNITVK
ncbi:MAG: metallophosphoesterase [Eubacteriales bacterium]